MRAQMVLLGLLATGTALAALGPGGQAPAVDRGKLRDEARSFDRQLHYLVGQVSDQYVRPVAAEDLYVAALTSLYMADRKTPPPDLRVQDRQPSNMDDTPFARTPPGKLLALRSQRVVSAAPPLTPGEPSGQPADPGPGTLRLTYRRPGEKTDRTATLLPERFRPESVLGVSRKDD